MSLCGRSRAILSFPVHELSGVEDVPRVEGELHALYQLKLCLVEEELHVAFALLADAMFAGEGAAHLD